MWFDDATIYQIYPLGLCGAPLQNDGSDQTAIFTSNILFILAR